MGFVDDDRVVAQELRVRLDFGEQNAVGHELDERVGRRLLGETNLIADLGTEVDAEFVGEPFSHRAGGDATRLRMPDHCVDAAAQLEADLW